MDGKIISEIAVKKAQIWRNPESKNLPRRTAKWFGHDGKWLENHGSQK